MEDRYRLPDLAAIDGKRSPADVRLAWGTEGLAFSVLVIGKKRSIQCSAPHPEESEGVQILIDTRDVHTVHRATRFCHRFAFLPLGGGTNKMEALAAWLPIHRAREHPRAIPPGAVRVACRIIRGGYELSGLIAAEALTGFDVEQHPRLGFNYVVLDRELGVQTFAVGPPMPAHEDPSLWTSLELVE